MAIVAEGESSRLYLPPIAAMEVIALEAKPEWKPESEMPNDRRWFSPPLYGMKTHGDLFTSRQLVALTTFSDLVQEVRVVVPSAMRRFSACLTMVSPSPPAVSAKAYADAVSVYCGLSVDKSADYNSSLVVWSPTRDQAKSTFARQAIPMVWDYAEVNPFAGAADDIRVSLEGIGKAVESFAGASTGHARQQDGATPFSYGKAVSTDPPYYDNIGYADLSDFFYVWLRRAMRLVNPATSSPHSPCRRPRSWSPRPTATAARRRQRRFSWMA